MLLGGSVDCLFVRVPVDDILPADGCPRFAAGASKREFLRLVCGGKPVVVCVHMVDDAAHQRAPVASGSISLCCRQIRYGSD